LPRYKSRNRERDLRLLKRLSLASIVAIAPSNVAHARDQIRVVGSSTVYPFTTTAAEQFGRSSTFKTPVVEATGTGGGIKLFCAGLGINRPDATNASRRMKLSEFNDCQAKGVKDIIELNIGFDGLTLAQSKKARPLRLTLARLFLALAKDVLNENEELVANPHIYWSDIDKSLPHSKIEIFGPPPTSGTRDSLHELLMQRGAEDIADYAALKKNNPKKFERIWKSIREDGAYVEAGENDNVIVQKLEGNHDAFGILGYSFLEENAAKLRGVALDGVAPDYDSITSGRYRGGRRIYVYFKKAHIGVVPGIDNFIQAYLSNKAVGEDGYLTRKGLIPLPAQELADARAAASDLTPMEPPSQ
jgi:phosphate transport system substrate-binding protein